MDCTAAAATHRSHWQALLGDHVSRCSRHAGGAIFCHFDSTPTPVRPLSLLNINDSLIIIINNNNNNNNNNSSNKTRMALNRAHTSAKPADPAKLLLLIQHRQFCLILLTNRKNTLTNANENITSLVIASYGCNFTGNITAKSS